MPEDIDIIKLNFNPSSLVTLNYILAFIMFGVSLELTVKDFRRLIDYPKISALGVLSQFIVLPILTFILIIIIQPPASIALGMIIVAACPGGNMSNFISYLAKANVALSVSLTAIGTVLSIFMTPINLKVWGGLYPPTSLLLKEVRLDTADVFKTVLLIAGVPLVLGMLFRFWKPAIAQKLSTWFKPLSILLFITFLVVAFMNNMDVFSTHIHHVFFIVLAHNLLGLSSGFFLARFSGLEFQEQKTIAIETGIQNSGLGLLLIFSFFGGLGGAALVAGWWGIWHIISGMTLGFFWSRKK